MSNRSPSARSVWARIRSISSRPTNVRQRLARIRRVAVDLGLDLQWRHRSVLAQIVDGLLPAPAERVQPVSTTSLPARIESCDSIPSFVTSLEYSPISSASRSAYRPQPSM
jgi:hypothetical protein